MKKKINLIILVIFAFIAGLVVFYFVRGQKSQISQGELSARSREYLEKKSVEDNTNSELKNVQLTGIPDGASGRTFTVGDCFTIQINFTVKNDRQKEGECHLYVSLARPTGDITVYQRFEGNYVDFDSVPGVSLRRIEKEKYKEKSHTIAGKDFLEFQNTKEGERTFFYYSSDSYLVITFDIQATDIEEEIRMTLESIKFLR